MKKRKKILLISAAVLIPAGVLAFILLRKKNTDNSAPGSDTKPNENKIVKYPCSPGSLISVEPFAITTKSGTRLRIYPNTQSTILKTFNADKTFYVEAAQLQCDDMWWLKVRENADNNYTGSQYRGWIRSDVVNYDKPLHQILGLKFFDHVNSTN